MQRRRAASLYPGTNKCGIAFWVLDDTSLRAVAVGSVPIETTHALIERFGADLVLMESHRGESEHHQAAVFALPLDVRVRRAHPSWRDSYMPLPNPEWGRVVGPFAMNATKLGFNELFRRGKGLKLKDFKPVQYSGSWLERWRSRRVINQTNA